jgi:LysR family transcriptional regulator, chromosome initiation inhibitor
MTYNAAGVEALVAIAEHGTFEAAARALHVTPSAVSQRVRALEREVGQVVVRRSTPCTPTEAGIALVRLGRQTRLLAAEAEAQLREQGARVEVTVAVNADSLATWFLDALAEAQRRTGAVFDVHRDDQDFTAGLLRDGVVMAAVTAQSRPVQGCVARPLGSMRYRAVATPAFRDRWMPGGSLAELDSAPLVDFDRKDDLQQGFLRRLLGHDPRSPRHFIPTSHDFARALELGMGWGLLPDQQSAAPLADGRLVELAPDRPIDVGLHWQRWNLASPLLDTLSEVVVAAASAALRTRETVR